MHNHNLVYIVQYWFQHMYFDRALRRVCLLFWTLYFFEMQLSMKLSPVPKIGICVTLHNIKRNVCQFWIRNKSSITCRFILSPTANWENYVCKQNCCCLHCSTLIKVLIRTSLVYDFNESDVLKRRRLSDQTEKQFRST